MFDRFHAQHNTLFWWQYVAILAVEYPLKDVLFSRQQYGGARAITTHSGTTSNSL